MARLIKLVLLCLFIIGCQAKTGSLSGKITYKNKPLAGVVVYAYETPNTGLKEEYLALSPPTDDHGHFNLAIKPGRYYLVARRRRNLAVTGPLEIGDYSGDYGQNPVQVKSGKADIGTIEVELKTSERNNSLQAEAGFITGKVAGDNLNTAYVYVYPAGAEIRGPAYEVAQSLDADGGFRLAVNPGSCYVLIRNRQSGKIRGPIAEDDWIGGSTEEMITVTPNSTVNLPLINLKTPDPVLWREVKAGHKINKTNTVISGIIIDDHKQPVKNVFAFIYEPNQVVGKPLAKSNFTGADGRYIIYLTEGGTYYLGARSSLGGPLEPGDWVGSRVGNPQHLIEIETGRNLEDITIEVKPFTE